MCLVTSSFYHKKDKSNMIKCFVAKEDILVYKCLDYYYYNGVYCTPFQYMPIVFTKGKYVYNKVNMKESVACCANEKFACIYSGIHAYSAKVKAIMVAKDFHKTNGTSMHYAVIPKGSNFYVGVYDNIVSNNLIVYRDKRCFDKEYESIIDFNKYIDKYLKEE